MHRILPIILLMLVLIPRALASVAGEVNKANDLYKQGKFDDSLGLYQQALGQDDRSPVVKYDLGTALYKKGEYAKALGYLEQASEDKNIKIKPKAEYNLGNVLYKSGIQKENTNVDEAIKSLQGALGQYAESLRDDPKDPDAKYNQDIVKKEIERLKQIKQQQQQQQLNQQRDQKQQQKQQNQQSKQDQKKQQGQQDQQKQQENQQNQQSNPKDQKDQQSPSESQAQREKVAQQQADASQKEYDRKEAEDLLEDYKENEEPKKLLSYMPKKIDDRPVLHDW